MELVECPWIVRHTIKLKEQHYYSTETDEVRYS